MTIPVTVSASAAVAKGERFEGPIALERLERLQEFAPGKVSAHLAVRRDAGGQGWVWGAVEGTLQLTCQTCERPFAWDFEAKVELALAQDEAEEERLLATSEPVLVQNDRLELHRLVEDEVLLALPMIPRCAACENEDPSASVEPEAEAVRRNPFAALKNTGLSGPSKTPRK